MVPMMARAPTAGPEGRLETDMMRLAMVLIAAMGSMKLRTDGGELMFTMM